jgi:hypothetical protein
MAIMDINIYTSSQINRKHWNEIISNASNGRVYMYTELLDAMCPGWLALQTTDKSAVMAIPLKQKWCIRYCWSVPFIQQLGIAGDQQYNDLFFQKMLSLIQYGDYAGNFIPPKNIHEGVTFRTCKNYVLSLVPDYEALATTYSADLKRNLIKAAKKGVYYKEGSIESAISLFSDLYSNRSKNFYPESFAALKQFCEKPQQYVETLVRSCVNSNEEILAISLLLKDNKRIYNLMNATPAAGRKVSANHYLIDSIIREFSGSELILDFEGSDIERIASFYQQFGAVSQPYSVLHINQLQVPFSWLRK